MRVFQLCCIVLISTLLLTLTNQAHTEDPPKKSEALRVIEDVRGGRHWVDKKTEPPKSPEDSKKTFQLEPGLEIELVASEPLVKDPVAITFDQFGQLYAVEYSDYPIGDPDGKPLSKIVLLEDTNNDGKSDVRHEFASGLNFAHSLMPFRGGILVGTTDAIIFLKDTTDDKKADVRKTLFSGFVQAHSQMHIGCPRWGLDNIISFNYGPGEIKSANNPDKPIKLPRKDFLLDPITMKFEADSGLGQFGNTIDRWGHRFYATNRNPIMMTRIPYPAMQRNTNAVIFKGHIDVAPSGGDSKVYPLIEMKSNYLGHAGTHTSACGTTAYTGDLLGTDYFNSVFVCEPVGNLVTRTKVFPDPNGSGLTSERAREKADFLAAADPWFRPGSLANGPDGALYLADMYRLWVEHPKFVPPEVAEKLDWRAGEDRGRIWRIKPKGAKPRPFTPPQTTADKVALLNDPNGWRRYLGQRLLVEDQIKEAHHEVRKLLHNSTSPMTRLHAFWTLDGLNQLKINDLKIALNDSDSYVRRSAVRLSPKFIAVNQNLIEKLNQLAEDKNSSVRYELALAAGDLKSIDEKQIASILSKLLTKDGRDSWMVIAILSSSKGIEGNLLAERLNDPQFIENAEPWKVEIVKQFASCVGAGRDSSQLKILLAAITKTEQAGLWWQSASLSGLAQGLPRYRGPLGRIGLSSLISRPPEELKNEINKIKSMLDATKQFALDATNSTKNRVAAIELMGFQPFSSSSDAYESLLSSKQPGSIQLATINSIHNGRTDAAKLILDRWPQLSPLVREPALAFLLRRSETTLELFEAMKNNVVQRSALSIDQRVRLLKHRDEKIKTQATKLLGGAVSPNRKAVASKYRKALELKTSITEGAKVFEKTCSKCHKRNGKGFVVGPDITDVRNRSKEALLYDMLDPNSKVEPRFSDYVIITQKGKTYNGLLISETTEAIVLRQAGGKEEIIPRSEILQLQATGKSLMPEGIEKEVTIQQMADLLEFLKSNQ